MIKWKILAWWRTSLAALFVTSLAVSSWAASDKLHKVGSDRIDNEYIVVLADDVLPDQVPDVARGLASAHAARLRRVWFSALKGFSVTMTEARAEAMSRSPLVKYVEENARAYLSGATTQTNVNPVTCNPTTTTCTTVADNRLWHLDRADQNYADPTNEYRYCTTGSNATIYVVDTGVVAAHQELTGRVTAGYNATGDGTVVQDDHMPANDPCLGWATLSAGGFFASTNTANYNLEWQAAGHGTAVASAAAGTRVGVAKNATIVPIKVKRCDQYSARYRRPSEFYQTNQTIFIPGSSGMRGIYRALNSGTTGSDDPFTTAWTETWPVGDTSNPRPTRVDNEVTWQFIPVSEWQNVETVEMIIDGLNWILSSANTQGPHSYAVVTMSTYEVATAAGVASAPPDRTLSMEDAIRSLIANNLTVIASANNQNGNACDTSPGRLSRTNPNPALQSKVITVGGTMIVNQPWTATLSDPPAVPSGSSLANGGNKGPQPPYVSTQGVREARWICGKGDSDPCNNTTNTDTALPGGGYTSWTGGSNGGACVTLFAPAKNLFLAKNTGPSDYRDARLDAALASGTSWSAPIVAGFAARLLELNPTATPDQIHDSMMANVTNGALEDSTEYPLNPRDSTGAIIPNTPNKVLRLADVHIDVQPQSTPIASSGTTNFTVTAGGTTTVSYQWYQVNSDFDTATYTRGAHPATSSTPIGTNSNTLQVTPTQQTAYWVRVTDSCGSADSDIAVATLAVVPPTNVTADGSGATVTIHWTTASGADGYKVQRKVSSAAWADAVTVEGGATATAQDQPATATGVVLYRVLSRNGQTFSAASNTDVAWVGTFTDDPLAAPPSYTTIKATHITEVRKAVNALRDIGGQLPVYSAADTDPANLRDRAVAAGDFTLLMAEVNNARTLTNVGLPAVGFRSTPSHDTTVLRTQIEDLRLGFK